MISEQNKFIFIHTAKTGGNSMHFALKDHIDDELHGTGSNLGAKNTKYNTYKHSNIRQYIERIPPELYKDCFRFSTIRNPWDRCISFYFSPHRGYPSRFDRNNFLRMLHSQVFTFRTYVCVNQTPYETPLDSDMDYIMRFESLQDDFDIVCGKIGLPKIKLPSMNKSRHTHYSHYYDDDLVDIVAAKYHEEIVYGGYTFERK